MKEHFSDREVEERIAFHAREEDRHRNAKQDWEQELRTRNVSRSIAVRSSLRPNISSTGGRP